MTKKLIENTISDFAEKNILIIGDVMVDAYLFGKVDRISPEAPVPVVSVVGRNSRMGGAANVALNIKSLGASPFLCSVIGADDRGNEFVALMEKEGMSTTGIIRSENRPTTTKFRVIGNNVQMLRVDEETTLPINRIEEKELTHKIEELINTKKIDAIIFEDYDKGSITSGLIKTITNLARKKNIVVTVDPKKRNFSAYSNLTLLKPNFKELKEGTGLDIEVGNIQSIRLAALNLMQKQNIEIVMVTLSEHGVLVCEKNTQTHIPAIVRTIADVSGAGDTVIATLTLALTQGMTAVNASHLANLAGGIVCEEVGVVPIEVNKLKLEAMKVLNF